MTKTKKHCKIIWVVLFVILFLKEVLKMSCPACSGMNPSCPCCGRFSPQFDDRNQVGGKLTGQKVFIDKPHEPFGAHVDVITPLKDIPGTQKLRIGTSGDILDEDLIFKKKWNPLPGED